MKISQKISLWYFSKTALTTFCLFGLTAASPGNTFPKDVDIRVGIVQRFGDNPKEQLLIEPTKGSKLSLKFKVGKKEQTVVSDKGVKIEVVMQKLNQPIVNEKVVLGTYRTYETAEDSAAQWRAKGLEVEIAQPERWEIWAKRENYSTPLLRRLLLQSVKVDGSKTSKIETKVWKQVPRVSWVLNGMRYSPTQVEITSDKNLIKVNATQKPERANLFPGSLEIRPNSYGNYTLINKVPLEEYLRGVVPYEIGITAPQVSLEAQAVIARTYALRNLRRFEIDDYELCADTHCQVYQGITGAAPTTDKAISSTRGMVLTYNNELVDALYSASTGGVTASFSDVWYGEDRPYLRPVIDAPSNIWNKKEKSLSDEENFQKFINLKEGFNESTWDMFRWRRESSLEDITKGLQKFLRVKNSPYAKFKQLKDMEVVERSGSGRILKLAVNTDIGTFYLHKDEVRSAFVAPISTLFYLQPLNKGKIGTLWGYAFVGGGMGHGVGLSQTGAQNLAKQGWSNANILQFYYPGTRIQILSDAIKK
ncbi:MAG: SpoIID/LytB domain-containing protein [Scytonematopsis contorta HA4267-MV1]|jgi:SpoIID/LytB domain protein|nr:SpoIID/LytB domain-containing protein [Scytonematopsis contorta HA4267-MV1]